MKSSQPLRPVQLAPFGVWWVVCCVAKYDSHRPCELPPALVSAGLSVCGIGSGVRGRYGFHAHAAQANERYGSAHQPPLAFISQPLFGEATTLLFYPGSDYCNAPLSFRQEIQACLGKGGGSFRHVGARRNVAEGLKKARFSHTSTEL